MEIYQRRQLESALKEFGSADIAEKELFEEKLFRLREMNYWWFYSRKKFARKKLFISAEQDPINNVLLWFVK